MSDPRALVAMLALVLVMLAVSWAVRRSTSNTLDFYLANRQVGPLLNACAICGDYFSAASFLGVAGAVYTAGLDGVWFATGFAAGFVVVLLFMAAPLRRAGQFSIPDFLANRFDSKGVRIAAVVIVQIVVLLYLIPQMTAAGLIWEVFVGRGTLGLSPYTTGILLSTAAIVLVANLGGMKGTTWNQALQFALKLFTVVLIGFVAFGHGFSYPSAMADTSREPLAFPSQLTRAQALAKDDAGVSTISKAKAVMSPHGYREAVARLDAGASRIDVLLPAENRMHPNRTLRFVEPGFRYSAVQQIALIVTLLLGTAGLPHITSRYFTSTSGRTARLATVWVLGLAGLFYFFAVMIGVAARSELPSLLKPGVTNGNFVDGIVRVPEKALLFLAREMGGDSLLALVSAAAFAAVFSTVAGLLIAAATSWGHDVYEQFVNPGASERRRIRFARWAVTVTALSAAAVGLSVPTLDFANVPAVALMVTWAFAVAGSAFTPVFLLGVWWKRTTARGALAGTIVGATVSLVFVIFALLGQIIEGPANTHGSFPSIIAAPLAALATVSVSLGDTPADMTGWWLRVHGTAQERHQETMLRRL